MLKTIFVKILSRLIRYFEILVYIFFFSILVPLDYFIHVFDSFLSEFDSGEGWWEGSPMFHTEVGQNLG